jgi:hypothetical protein
MKRVKWPPEQVAVLMDLAGQGLSRREIATQMGITVKAVTTKLLTIPIYLPLNPESYRTAARRRLCPVRFPRFENVTRSEAHAAARGAPRSARPSRTYDFSLTGNAADMCAS